MGSHIPLHHLLPIASSVGGSLLLTASGVIERSDGKFLAEWLPLRRALHGDRMKIQALTQGDPDMKISNPRLMTRMRNNSQYLSVADLQAPLVKKFLTMNFYLVIDWIGTGSAKVPDGCHLCQFMPESHETYPYFKFPTVEDIITATPTP